VVAPTTPEEVAQTDDGVELDGAEEPLLVVVWAGVQVAFMVVPAVPEVGVHTWPGATVVVGDEPPEDDPETAVHPVWAGFVWPTPLLRSHS
jgi:hypothetical protein